jgi:hypothetical protein
LINEGDPENIFLKYDLGLENPEEYTYMFGSPYLDKCGAYLNPLCFNDGKTHTIRLRCTGAKHYTSDATIYFYDLIDDYFTFKCEPCTYEVIIEQNPCDPRKFGRGPCCVTISLVTHGGLNDQGCIGGYEFLKTGIYYGRYHSFDEDMKRTPFVGGRLSYDTDEDAKNNFAPDVPELNPFKYFKLSVPPVPTHGMLRIELDKEPFSDTLVIYDLCGKVIETRDIFIRPDCLKSAEDVQ